jgi:hypothetical protein
MILQNLELGFLIFFFFFYFFYFFYFFFFFVFSIFLKTEKKKLYGCGGNYFNQIGTFYRFCNLLFPKHLEFFNNKEIENIFLGSYGTHFVCKSKSYNFIFLKKILK